MSGGARLDRWTRGAYLEGTPDAATNCVVTHRDTPHPIRAGGVQRVCRPSGERVIPVTIAKAIGALRTVFDGADPSTEVALPLGLPHSRRSNRPDLKGRSGRAAGTVNDVTRSLLPSVCSTCGASYERDTTSARCPECHPTRHQRGEDRRGSAASRGYDRAWRRLSRRARRLQPWCTDCGSPDDLTADHSPAAWDAHERGESITLDMVDVVCRRCNGSRGAARGPDAVERHTIADDHDDLARAGRLTLGRVSSTKLDDDHGGEG